MRPLRPARVLAIDVAWRSLSPTGAVASRPPCHIEPSNVVSRTHGAGVPQRSSRRGLIGAFSEVASGVVDDLAELLDSRVALPADPGANTRDVSSSGTSVDRDPR
jgi:hypothetical protein